MFNLRFATWASSAALTEEINPAVTAAKATVAGSLKLFNPLENLSKPLEAPVNLFPALLISLTALSNPLESHVEEIGTTIAINYATFLLSSCEPRIIADSTVLSICILIRSAYLSTAG